MLLDVDAKQYQVLFALLNRDLFAEIAFYQRGIRKPNRISSEIIKPNLYWHQHSQLQV